MQSISTKTGDTGMTSLANGQRVAKDSLVIELIGTIDELNSWLGLIVVKLEDVFEQKKAYIQKLQQHLYEMSAEIAQAPQKKLRSEALQTLGQQAEELQAGMRDGWHSRFLYPGGTELGAYLDLARAVCRRAERISFSYAAENSVSETIPIFLNRLSDYLYLLRCYINLQQKHSEKQF